MRTAEKSTPAASGRGNKDRSKSVSARTVGIPVARQGRRVKENSAPHRPFAIISIEGDNAPTADPSSGFLTAAANFSA